MNVKKKKIIKASAKRGLENIRSDGWENTVTGLGNVSRDKMSYMGFSSTGKIPDQTLENLFDDDDIANTIVSALPEEAFRRDAYATTTADIDGETKAAYGQIIDERLRSLNAHLILEEAAIWGRLFGGGIVVISADDGQPFSEPLIPERVRAVDSLDVFDRRDFWSASASSEHGETLNLIASASIGNNLQTVEIHESRLLIFPGAKTTRRGRLNNSGWDNSVLRRCRKAMEIYASDWLSVSNMMSDSSQGVLKIKGFYDLLAGGYRDQFSTRLDIMQLARFVGRLVPIDSEESLEYVERSFSGIPDLLNMTMYRLSAAARMPATVLFGRSPAGMNSTGDSDMEIWNNTVETEQRQKYGPLYDYLVRLIAYSVGAPEPQSWGVEWQPLSTPSEKEQAEIRKIYADIDASYITSGTLDPDEVAAARFKGGWSDEAPVADMALRTPSVATGSSQEDSREDEMPPMPADLEAVLDAIDTLHSITAPDEIMAPLIARAAALLSLSMPADEEVFMADDPVESVAENVQTEQPMAREDYAITTAQTLIDLHAIRVFSKAKAAQWILRALADRVATASGIATAATVEAIANHDFEVRSKDTTFTVSVKIDG